MLRRTLFVRSEFESKKWYDRLPLPVTYGDGLGKKMQGRKRYAEFLWRFSFRVQTVESNRLTNRKERYGTLLSEFDTQKNADETKVDVNQVRMYDHRKLWWVCKDCKTQYNASLTFRQLYGYNCPRCKDRYPSQVLRHFSPKTKTVGEEYPELLAELSPKENKDFIKSLDATSAFKCAWTCRRCSTEYSATVRQRTGHRRPDGVALEPSKSEFCPNCTWTVRMSRIADRVKAEGGQGFCDLEEGFYSVRYDPYRGTETKHYRTEVEKVSNPLVGEAASA
jgi:hypothetical protein